MKKLNLILLLALLVTIGGVYAAWIYPGDGVNNAQTSNSIVLEAEKVEGNKGEIVISNNSLTFEVVDDNGDHVAELKMSGSFDVKFVVNPAANPSDVNDGAGIALKLNISESFGNFVYDDVITDVVVVDTNDHLLNAGNPVGGEVTVTVYATEADAVAAGANPTEVIILADLVHLGDIKLGNLAAYEAFEAFIADTSRTITFTVSEKTA